MKRFAIIFLLLACLLALSACGCKHEVWSEADCINPKTCTQCGQTEGEALGHTWRAADCETPKACETCGTAEGAALGHSWVDATCEAPKACSACKLTEGEALGHIWKDATTEAPKTCTACAKTEGERIITDPRFTTAATMAIQGSWIHTFSMTGEMMGMEGFTGTFDCLYHLELSNDGKMEMSISIADEDAFKKAMLDYVVESLYAEFALSGLNREQADAAMNETYGMDIKSYAATVMDSIDVAGLFESMGVSGVYYVDGNILYRSMSWEMEMESITFELEDDKLIILEDVTGMDAERSVFTKVTEEP